MKQFIRKLASKLNPKGQSAKAVPTLNALGGKIVVFQGRFDRRQRDRLAKMTDAQQGRIADDLNGSVHYLVLADTTAGKVAQQKAASLNTKGASIQVLDVDSFEKMVTPTQEQVVALMRGGKAGAELLTKALGGGPGRINPPQSATYNIVSEKFDHLELSGIHAQQIQMQDCSFVGATLTQSRLGSTIHCDFSKANADSCIFTDVTGSRFCGANLSKSAIQEGLEGTIFDNANMDSGAVVMLRHRLNASVPRLAAGGASFKKVSMKSIRFNFVCLDRPDFEAADLTSANFHNCEFGSPSFHWAILRDAMMARNNLAGADFTGADLRGANFVDADLSRARFDGADMEGADLDGAKLDGADLSKAKNYKPVTNPVGGVGAALAEFDSVAGQARRIRISFKFQRHAGDPGLAVHLDTFMLKYGWGVRLPQGYQGPYVRQPAQTPSGAILQMAGKISRFKILYETLEVKSTKSPKAGKNLRELVMNAIAEATMQPVPPADQLAAAIKALRGQTQTATSGQRAAIKKAREQREEYKKREEALKKRELKKIEKTIEKKVGKITDIATFLKALELRADVQKIDKATKMLKADRFKLFNDVTDDHLSGVVKSQSDPDLLYACRIHKDGAYACCTQNMNICGGLRGSVCKHLLVLVVGLVKAGQLDPGVIDSWISKTYGAKPVLDKEIMGEIFLKYKGAEAGEIDWRPTETLPEDFYAV